MKPTVGDMVTINTPDNSHLHGASAVVFSVEPWGVHLITMVGSGKFRALWDEVVLTAHTPPRASSAARPEIDSGVFCDNCGSMNMLRTGSCFTCGDCGTAGGCG